MAAIKSHIDTFMKDFKETGYFVAGFLSTLTSLQLDKSTLDKVKTLIEELASQKVTLDTFHHATFYLVLQNLVKFQKLKIDNAKYELIENNCAAVSSTKNLGKYFEEILTDDSVNISHKVPFFEALCANVLERSNEKALSKLFKFFQQTLSTLEKDKNLRQKRAFHLVNFFRCFLARVDSKVLLALDIDSSLQKRQVANGESESESISDIFVGLMDFWMKQVGNKNSESRQASVELDHVLTDKVKNADKHIGPKLVMFLLKILKQSPTNSLRGGDLRLMQTLLGHLYQDEKLFSQYFSLLTDKLKGSKKVAEINFFLNELEHLGQIGLSAKLHKDMQGHHEVDLRVSVLQTLIELFMLCESEEVLGSYFGQDGPVEWNEQDLSFKKFRTKVFERINNLVFKRDDPIFLARGAEIYAKAASNRDPDLSSFFKTLKEAAIKIDKTNPTLANLFRALIFMNVYEDDISRNADIVGDLVKASQQMAGSSGPNPAKKIKAQAGSPPLTSADSQQPEDVFVDGLIALCSTTQAQLKPLITHAFESCCERVSKGGFSVLFQAILKPDSQYLRDEGEDEEDEDEEQEDGVSEKHANGHKKEKGDEEEDVMDEDETLIGKRKTKQNKKVDHKKSNNQQKSGHHNGKGEAGPRLQQEEVSNKKEKKTSI